MIKQKIKKKPCLFSTSMFYKYFFLEDSFSIVVSNRLRTTLNLNKNVVYENRVQYVSEPPVSKQLRSAATCNGVYGDRDCDDRSPKCDKSNNVARICPQVAKNHLR